VRATVSVPRMALGEKGLTLIVYVGTATRVQRGVTTCHDYRFLPGAMQYVDARDVTGLLDALTQDSEPAFVEV